MIVSELIKLLSAYNPTDKVFIGYATDTQSWDEQELHEVEDITEGDVDASMYFNEDGDGAVVITG